MRPRTKTKRQKGSALVPPDDVSDEPGVEPGGNRGPRCPGLCERRGTGVPGSVRLITGLPMGAL